MQINECDELAEAVGECLVVMAEILANPKPLTAPLLAGWTLVLREAGIAPDELRAATARILATEKFFPTPADFLKLLRPPEEREAAEELAWQRVLTALRAHGSMASLVPADLGGDGAALWALDRIGLARLGRELTEENRAIWRAEFIRLYRVGRSTHAELGYLTGEFERQNASGNRDLNPLTVGRPDWLELPACRTELPALTDGELRELAAV